MLRAPLGLHLVHAHRLQRYEAPGPRTSSFGARSAHPSSSILAQSRRPCPAVLSASALRRTHQLRCFGGWPARVCLRCQRQDRAPLNVFITNRVNEPPTTCLSSVAHRRCRQSICVPRVIDMNQSRGPLSYRKAPVKKSILNQKPAWHVLPASPATDHKAAPSPSLADLRAEEGRPLVTTS